MNDITGDRTPASFKPSIDYVVTKIQRFNFEKFAGTNDRLTTQMKSVGEVMAISHTQQESLQKALRGLEVGASGFDSKVNIEDPDALITLQCELKDAGGERICGMWPTTPSVPACRWTAYSQPDQYQLLVPGANRGAGQARK